MLRPAVISDLEDVFEIYMDPTVNPYISWEQMGLEEFRPIFRELLSRKNPYVYEMDGNVVGTIRLERQAYRLSHVGRVGGFGIRSQFQNRGLGSIILREAIKVFQEGGILRVELIVESDNPRAIRLYEKLGFEVEGKLRKYFKRKADSAFVDDLYMSLLFE